MRAYLAWLKVMVSRVLGIAAINKDYISITDDPVEDREDAVINEELFENRKRGIKTLYECVGGSVINTLYAFRQIDSRAQIHIHGIIGNDADGMWILDKLRDYKLKFIGYIHAELPTGKTLILSSRLGSRRIIVFPGVNDLYSRELVYPLEEYQQQDIVHTSTFACTRGTEPIKAQILALNIIESSLRSLMFGSLYCEMFKNENYRPLIESLLKSVDIIFAREDEILQIFENIDHMLTQYSTIKLAAITMGSRGVKIISRNCEEYYPAPKVDEIVDTTGAGDAFAGGFLVGYVRGYTIKRCVELGIICARECLRNIGGTGYTIKNYE